MVVAKQKVAPSSNTSTSLGTRALTSINTARALLSRGLGEMFGGRRDLYSTFGYVQNFTYQEGLKRYRRLGVVSRVVNAYPDAIWAKPPTFLEGDLKKGQPGQLDLALSQANRAVGLWGMVARADRLAGIGPFSVLLLGFNDVRANTDMVKPVRGGVSLVYVQAYGFGQVKVLEWETDIASEFFGMPKIYGLSVLNPAVVPAGDTVAPATIIEVHRDRVVHVKDCSLDSNIYGYPILERIYNSMDDIEKVVGGSAEMYWLNGRGGMQIDIAKDAQFSEAHAENLRQQVDDYVNDLTRVLRTRGVDIKQLNSVASNPAPVFAVVMSMISIASGIPQRIFIGSEQGKLASEQDRANWAVRINERRQLQSEPDLLRPLVARLQKFGILPEEDYSIDWPEAFQLSPLERAQAAAQQARSAVNIVRAAQDYAKPIEGVDYAISRPGQTVSGGGAAGGGFGKGKTFAGEPDKEKKKDDAVTKADDKKPEGSGEKPEAPKPVVIPNEEIQVERRQILSPTEMRQIIFAEGDLKGAATIDVDGEAK